MDANPYSVYLYHRPIRYSYFVGKSTPDTVLDSIVQYCHKTFGGRFSTLHTTDGASLEDHSLELLRAFDPDVIVSMVRLNATLRSEIESTISPLTIHEANKEEDTFEQTIAWTDPQNGLIQISLAAIESFHPVGGREPQFVLFDGIEDLDPAARTFVERNFGTVASDRVRHLCESGLSTLPITVSNRNELAAALNILASSSTLVFPSQLSTLPRRRVDLTSPSNDSGFAVIVGDTASDFCSYWNNYLTLSEYGRHRLSHLWLPFSLASDPELQPSLKRWLLRFADPGGTTNQDVTFRSHSLGCEALAQVAIELTHGTFLRSQVSNSDIVSFAPPRPTRIAVSKEHELYRAAGEIDQIVVEMPSFIRQSSGARWMADVMVEHRDEWSRWIHGMQLWWQFPRQNQLPVWMFGRTARVTRSRLPAVVFSEDSRVLNVKLSQPEAFIHGALLQHTKQENRDSAVVCGYAHVERSEKGRLLAGLLDAFDGLYNAHSFLEKRFWRDTFGRLANRTPNRDAGRREIVLGRLRKLRIFDPDERDREQQLEHIAQWVLELAANESGGRAETFATLRKCAEKEIAAAREAQLPSERYDEWEADLTSSMSQLIDLGALRVGIQPNCSRCTYAHWYETGTIRRILECPGCGNQFAIRPELPWYYRLNSLVEVAVSRHGLVPVVLVLGELLRSATTSFIFAPSVDLFEGFNEPNLGDLDIACILNGEFVIGEIKHSCKLFKEEDIQNLCAIAIRVRADRVIFAALEAEPCSKVGKFIERARPQLARFEIRVEWYQLTDYIFEPSMLL
jgi:hypothetical protein